MNRLLFPSLIVFLFAPSLHAASRSFGDGVTLDKPTAIAEILEHPDRWKDKVVRVEGKVSGVCAKKGCWMELRDEEGRKLRIKVQDDVIVFPAESLGKAAVAQGKVQLIELDRESYVGWMLHLAEEQGQVFDESKVGEGPYRIVQIAGTGATI